MRDSPPLVPQTVNLTPSPPPDYCSSESSEPPPSASNGRKRPKPQAYQGDFLLINFLGGHNHPETANRAGEEPLPASDDSDLESPMAVHSIHSDRSHRPDSMRLAESALLLSDKSPDRQTFQNRSLLSSEARPLRPTIFTDTTRSPPETFRLTNLDEARSDLSTSSLERHSPMNPDQKLSRAVTDGPIVSSRRGLDRSSFSRPRSRSPLSNSDNTQTSPPLRSNTVPVPSQHSSQTLPPIQSQFPSPNASKSPKNTESLPSIEQSNLKDLLNSRLPTDSRFTDLNRTQAPVTSSLSSPTQSTKSVKPPTQSYPSPKTRIGSAFPVVYTHGQPSPVPSDASPRELGAMSPPDKPGVPPFAQINRNKSPVLNDELTPQSANSYPSSTSFSTVTSPQAPDPMDVDRAGRVLPPLVPHPGPPVMSGSFKCEYSGCTAAPFQTQYLLK